MFPSDLTGGQWAKLEPLLQQPRGERRGGGRPRKFVLRRIMDALLYVVKAGCQWRQLPTNFLHGSLFMNSSMLGATAGFGSG